ncbi:MAG: DUF2726 domain-containing protein [Burkholderiaceae bacterium]
MFLFKRKANKRTNLRFTAIPILTKTEEEFFIRLCRALPTCYIFPKVAIAALLEPKDLDDKPRKAGPAMPQKIVDYAIYDADLKPICVIDLGNDSRNADAGAVSIDYFKGSGIKSIRCESRAGLSAEQISKTIVPMLKPVTPRMESETYLGAATVQMIYQADPVPSNIKGLSLSILDQLTPNKVLQNTFPHIWQRICLFAPDPKHLHRYLDTLTMQDRGEKRAGFSLEVLKEITDIKAANDRFLRNSDANWHTGFVNL